MKYNKFPNQFLKLICKYVGNYWNFAYFWVNVEIFQNTIMDDANVSKQIDEERCLSIKQEIVL